MFANLCSFHINLLFLSEWVKAYLEKIIWAITNVPAELVDLGVHHLPVLLKGDDMAKGPFTHGLHLPHLPLLPLLLEEPALSLVRSPGGLLAGGAAVPEGTHFLVEIKYILSYRTNLLEKHQEHLSLLPLLPQL